jgi:hypothetical protein
MPLSNRMNEILCTLDTKLSSNIILLESLKKTFVPQFQFMYHPIVIIRAVLKLDQQFLERQRQQQLLSNHTGLI